jgi:Flp pilus assembly protein TadD
VESLFSDKLRRIRRNVYIAVILFYAMRLLLVSSAVASNIDDDYLQLDKKMAESKKKSIPKKNKTTVIENEELSSREREILRQTTSESESVRDAALQELKNIEKEKENAKLELERQKQDLLRKEEENKKLAKDTEEYNKRMKEIEIEKEKVLLKERELEEFNAKIKEQERKIKEEQQKIVEEQKKFAAKQEEIRLQNIQKEKEMERQLSLKQKELEDQLSSKQKALEEQLSSKQKELEEKIALKEKEIANKQKEIDEQMKKIQKEKEEQEKKVQLEKQEKEAKEQQEKMERQQMADSLKNSNNEIKEIVSKNSEELKQEFEGQKKETEQLKQQLDSLKDEQQKTLQDIKNINILNAGRKNPVKNTNYNDSLFIANKVERNLTTRKKVKKNNDAFIKIKKGAWDDEDTIEVEHKEFEIKKVSKKQDGESVLTNDAKEIKSMKDKAYLAIQNNDHEAAIVYYKKILEKDAEDNFAKLSLATTYHTIGQYKQAKPLYLELVDVFPQSEQLVSNLLSIMIQESPHEAVYLIPGIAERHQDSAIIQAQMGVAFANVEKYPEAIKYMQKALSISPYDLDFKYNLALFYDLNKNYKEAKTLYNEILSSDILGDNVRTNNIKKRLSKM